MKQVDAVVLVLLILFGLRGFWRGFFRESFGCLALVAGLLAALQWTGVGADHLAGSVHLDPPTRAVVAFVGIFMVAHTAVNLLGLLFDRLTRAVFLRAVSRVGGVLFGVCKGAAFAAFLLLFLRVFPIWRPLNRQVNESRLARPMVSLAETVIRDYWYKGAASSAAARA